MWTRAGLVKYLMSLLEVGTFWTVMSYFEGERLKDDVIWLSKPFEQLNTT